MSHKKRIVYNKKNIEIEINSDADESVFGEIFQEREYKILEPIIEKANGAILDIGAHTGMFSIYCAALNSAVKIFAYEPDEANFTTMKENFRLNNVKNVKAKNVAVGASLGERVLYLSRDSHNHSILSVEATGDFSGEEVKVQAVNLERIFAQNHLEKVNLVKMDCEGAEFEILESLFESADGGRAIFSKIENFYVECHRYTQEMNPVKLMEIFKRAGYKTEMWSNHYDKRMGFILARRS